MYKISIFSKMKLLVALLFLSSVGLLPGGELTPLVKGLMAHQLPDGAVRMAGSGGEVWICPYFSHLGIFTALKSIPETPELQKEILDGAERWFQWYAAHQDPTTGFITDYRGTVEEYRSTGNFDSTDSYAALYLTALEAYVEAGGKPLPEELKTAAHRALLAVQATFEPDGLTWAKPDHRTKYLMDNLEVNIGLQSGYRLFQSCGMEEDAALAEQLLKANTAAMKRFLLPERGYYAWAITETDEFLASLDKYYPDLMANAFAAAMFQPPNRQVWHLVADSRRQALADARCARSYCAALRIGDRETADLIQHSARQAVAALADPAAERLDLLYDLIIILRKDPDFWPPVPALETASAGFLQKDLWNDDL